MSSRLMDPAAGARESAVNRRMAQAGESARFCYHSDCTLESVTENGMRMVRRICDYCPAWAATRSGTALPVMLPWVFRVE